MRTFEQYLAVVAAIGCVVFTVVVWVGVSRIQTMWPLPALYLIEVSLLGVIAALAFTRGGEGGRIFTWAAIGMLAAFSILGLFSVGGLYLPSVLLLLIISLSADVRNKSNLFAHLVVGLTAGILQAALMLALVHAL